MDAMLHTFISKDSKPLTLLQTTDQGTNFKVYNSRRLMGRTEWSIPGFEKEPPNATRKISYTVNNRFRGKWCR